MASINLRPKYAELGFSQNLDNSGLCAITLVVEPDKSSKLGFKNWLALRNVKWTIRIRNLNNEKKQERSSIGYFSYQKEYTSSDNDFYLPDACSIDLEIGRDIFDQLLSCIQAGSLPDQISVDVSGLETDWDGCLTDFGDKEILNAPITQIWFSTPMIATNAADQIAVMASHSVVRDYFVKEWVLNERSQIAAISKQLIISLNAWLQNNPREQKNKTDYIEDIADLIDTLRGCGRYFNGETDEQQLFWLKVSNGEIGGNPENFLKAIEKFTNAEQELLKQRYDNTWSIDHPGIMEVLEGRIRKHHPPLSGVFLDYPLVQSEHLEQVASLYMSNIWMESSYLEILIIDALLFNETSAFALSIIGKPTEKLMQRIIIILLKPIKLYISEVFALTLTGVFSNLIDSTVGVTFWIVFATITLGRWLNPVKVQRVIEAGKPNQLLVDMASTIKRIQKPEFNARLLRELLYDLEKRGAFYSPAIFNLLDKRVARESSESH